MQYKDAESMLGDAGFAGQLKKMLAKRKLTIELNRHLADEEVGTKNHRNSTSSKR